MLVKVSDNGLGIRQDLIGNVFDLFVQDDASLDRRRGGLGIGLTIVRSIVELHGGSVAVRSGGLDQGSEFLVRLPLLRLPPPPPLGGDEPLAAPAARLRVLIVDDNVDAAETLAVLLQSWGHDTQVRHNATSALEAAAAFRPQVALLDIGLPQINGYQLAKALRTAWPPEEPVLLVAVTGYGDNVSRQLSEEAGFDHHLTKPVDFNALESLLSRLSPKPRLRH